ncbi:hypothetical protein lerEdw1_000789 [Lerista edwardsae]|nr:hypothetical protein lerEdw1_000790 [Lerista edwardsae]KAJ6651122.1 hypothetical protein lerEdw1_000789 [Lerista edwardsae]
MIAVVTSESVDFDGNLFMEKQKALPLAEKKSRNKLESAHPAPANKTFPPVFLKGLTDLKVMDGSQVIMTVEVSANPPPELIWLHNGKEIQETEDFHFEKKGNEYSLYIQEVFPEDTGKYTCEAWNVLGESRTQATLTVQEPQDGIQPWFISKPRSVTATPGQNILISCAIAGDPFPAVHWLKDGQEVTPEAGYEFLQNDDIFTLIIRNVQSRHAGQYEIQLNERQAERRDADDHSTLTFRSLGGFRKNTGEAQQVEEEQEDVRGVLKRRVETRESTEEKLRQQEAEQIDFRDILAKKVNTRSISEEELKEIPAEQMDFRANLQRQVKPKTLSEEERKVHAPQQVDFRAVLAKKGTPKPAVPEKTPAPKAATPDFRSVLGAKKKPPTENGDPGAQAQNAKPNSEVQKPIINSKALDSKMSPASKAPDTKNISSKALDSNTTSEAKNAGTSSKMQNASTNSEKPAAKPVEKKENNGINCEGGCPPIVDGGIIEEQVQDNKKETKGTLPTFTEKLQDTHVVEGEKLVLRCQVSSDPPAAITWTLDGKVIKSSKFIVLSQEGKLIQTVSQPHGSLLL